MGRWPRETQYFGDPLSSRGPRARNGFERMPCNLAAVKDGNLPLASLGAAD